MVVNAYDALGLPSNITKQEQQEDENDKEVGDFTYPNNRSVSENVTRPSIEYANKAIRLTDDYSSRTIAANTAISVCLGLAILSGLILWLLAVKKPKTFNWLFRSCGFKAGKTKHAAVLLKMVPTMHRMTVQDYLLSMRIPLQHLKISKKAPLHEEDGICIRGATIKGWSDATGSTSVVVKTLTDKGNKEAKACLIEELNILLSVGRHLNIDNLLGVVVESRPVLILEHCPYGTLSDFLSSYRNKSNLDDSQYQSILDAFGNYVPSPTHSRQQQSRAFGRSISIHHLFPEDQPQVLNTHILMDFAYQVVRGMSYLASRRIVHGSLKGQRVYVGMNNVLKISDIGLRLHQTEGKGSDANSTASLIGSRGDVVVNVQQAPEDFQEWTLAPEVLHDLKFSERSDVWAFGVLLYEIFALGAVPDRDHSFMPKNVYTRVVKPCWEAIPRRRKRFYQLKSALEDLLSPTTLYHYSQLDQPYNEFNEENKEYLAMNQYSNLQDFDEDDIVEEEDEEYDEKEEKDWSNAEGIAYDDIPVAGQV